MDKINLGIYEKALPNELSIKEKLRFAKEIGFNQLEISIDESDEKLNRLYNGFSKKLLQAQIDEGMRVRTMCLSGHRKYPMGSLDKNIREKSLDIMQKAIEFADLNSIKIIQLAGYDVYYEESSIETEKYFIDNLIKAVEMASKYGLILAFETMETSFMDTVKKSMKYVRLINSPYLGIYPDIGNLKNAAVKYGKDVIEDLKEGKGYIFAAHLKETNPGIYRDMEFGSGGHTEYERCIKELKNQNVALYTGEFWNHGEENYKDIIKNAYEFLEKKLK
ncbi:L-ribulose-5-phosphate 3-epimerase [Anaerococcus porci]|uniref:L-ribulose-5-phosphate 3-epimerase n=1 Tax=Anaerococcus porci TaxID=2652269 RepID=UPI002A74FB13|nr:L-ribulose-5-phosphate 3-epimerase [Anaerococcus porci]MDY3006700.1 L-ribulose-5-phosphate 3-epimerase [Anaerococcus porci]